MACFLVPMAEAVITTAAVKVLEAKERGAKAGSDEKLSGTLPAVPFSRKLKWLSNLLWGGCGLVAFEHLWHGEIIPSAPFLTAAATPAGTAEMIHEMATTGVTMAVLVTAAWAGMVAVSYAIEKKAARAAEAKA